jgi:hypothetical protein
MDSTCTQLIQHLRRSRERREGEGGKGSGADLVRTPDEQATYRRKDDGDDEEGWKDGLGCQDRLPRLESLLLESGV